jgi:hypothetical protein
MTSGADLVELQKLRKLADSIKETDRTKKAAKTWGGGRTPDQAATVRLEPYVDVGLINKANRFEYEYSVTDRQALFFMALDGSDTIDSFIQTDLVQTYLSALDVGAPQRMGADEIWPRIVGAYRDMHTALGYAAFKELVLLAIGRLLNEGGGRYFEIEDGIDAIKQRQREAPRTVQLTAARGGELRYVRIAEPRRER